MSCTDTDYVSPAPTADQTLNDTELTGFKEVKLVKKRKRKSRSSGSPQNQPSKKVNITEVINMDGQELPLNQPTPNCPGNKLGGVPKSRIIGIRKTY